MTTAISGPNLTPLPADAGRPAAARPARIDPFEQLLNLNLETPASPTGTGATDWLGLSGLGSDSNSAGGMSQMLTYTLLRVLERLIDDQAAGAAGGTPSAPRGWPVTGPISQDAHAGHQAVDIAVPVGTPVAATMDGQVTYAGWNAEGYGNLVIVENGPYRTYFAHLDSIPVKAGQAVRAGDVIGLSGNTGNSTGPHLHYEVRLNGQAVAPGLPA